MTKSDHIFKMKPLYTFRGKVIRGKGRGKVYDMPTANIDAGSCGDLPELGVYASLTTVENDRFISVTNIGYRPSVDDEDRVTIETHILDFDKEIYGQEITLELYHFLRATRQFDSLHEVKDQINQDLVRTKELFSDFIV